MVVDALHLHAESMSTGLHTNTNWQGEPMTLKTRLHVLYISHSNYTQLASQGLLLQALILAQPAQG
jgi:hypothetical protein